MEHHQNKKHLATWGLEPASLVLVNRHALLNIIIKPQKRMQQVRS